MGTIEGLTAVLVVVTAYYAWTTRRILRSNEAAVAAMQEQSEALSRPYVQATLGLLADAPIYVLTIKNHGRTSAKNLQLELDRDYFAFRGGDRNKNLRELHAFRETIESFPPDAELNFWLGTAADVHAEQKDSKNAPEGFRVTVSYEFGSKRVSETTVMDFRPFLWSDLPRHHVAHELKGIKSELEKIAAQRKL